MRLACSRYVLSRTARSGEPDASSQASIFLLTSQPCRNSRDSGGASSATGVAAIPTQYTCFFENLKKCALVDITWSDPPIIIIIMLTRLDSAGPTLSGPDPMQAENADSAGLNRFQIRPATFACTMSYVLHCTVNDLYCTEVHANFCEQQITVRKVLVL